MIARSPVLKTLKKRCLPKPFARPFGQTKNELVSGSIIFHPKNMKRENNNPRFKSGFNILLDTQSIVCATVDSFRVLGIYNYEK